MPTPRLATLLTLATTLAAPVAARAQSGGLPEASSDGTHVVNGRVSLVTKIDLAAPEAGILTHVAIQRGTRFDAEDILAEIDSREAVQAYKRAQAEFDLAVKRSEDDIEIRYADAQEKVEQADYLGDMEANSRRPGAVPAADLRKSKLEWERSRLGAEKSRKDRVLSEGEVLVKKAEVEAALIAIEKRQVRARFAGEVLRMNREEGEWVQPGDTIAEIARFDTLYVDGNVYFHNHSPQELDGCRVTVDVRVAPGRTETATGYIVYVDPTAVFEGVDKQKYLVRAEIANRQEQGHWLISPGLPAKMTIHLGSAGDGNLGRRPTGRPAAR